MISFFIEQNNLYIKAVPLDLSSKKIEGSLGSPDYTEEYNIFKYYPRNYLGTVVNGVFYSNGSNTINDVSTSFKRLNREIIVKNFPTIDEKDKACALISKPSFRDGINTMIFELKNLHIIKQQDGNKELYCLPELYIYELVGLNVNGVLYCHPDHVECSSDTLIMKRIEILPGDSVYIIYNIKRKNRKKFLPQVREDKNLFPVLDLLDRS